MSLCKVLDSKGSQILEEKETVTFATSTHSLRLIPRVSGLHEYTFHLLDDGLYKAVSLERVHHNFTIFEYDSLAPEMAMMVISLFSHRPNPLKFIRKPNLTVKEDKVRACQNLASTLSLQLQGQPPFVVDYSLTDPARNKTDLKV